MSLPILFWNIRRLNPAGMTDAARYEPIMGVIGKASLTFIIENMTGTQSLVDALLKKLSQYGGSWDYKYESMGGYKGTDEKIILLYNANHLRVTNLWAMGKDGAWDGKTASFNRLLMMAELADGTRIGCVHYPGPQSGADHSAELTSCQGIAAAYDILLIGGDFNMPPPLGGTKWQYLGPTYSDLAGTHAYPTTINKLGQFASCYDWVVGNIAVAAQLASRGGGVGAPQVIQGYAKVGMAHYVTDHVPVCVPYTPPKYKKK